MKIGSAVRPGRVTEKKRTGQDSQKSHKVVIFRLFREKLPLYRIKPKFSVMGNLPDIITCKVSIEILGGTISHWVDFPIFLLILAWALQQWL